MALTDEQIKQLLEWFVNESKENKKWASKRKSGLDEHHKWIQPHIIQNLSDEKLEENYLKYYKTGSGYRQNLNQVNRDRVIRDKKKFRDTIKYLFDETIDVKERVNQVLKGSHRIKGMGKALATSLLMDYKPEKYSLWNNKSDLGFSVLGWNIYESRDQVGLAYQKVLDALNRLKNLHSELGLTFLEADFFLHVISATDEGIEMVKKIKGDVDDKETHAIRDTFIGIMNNYIKAKSDPDVRTRLRNDFKLLESSFENMPTVKNYKNIIVKFGMGMGHMANIPWIALLDRRETKTTQKGVYCVYLIKADMSGLYLTFNQGVGKTEKSGPTKSVIEEVHKNALTDL